MLCTCAAAAKQFDHCGINKAQSKQMEAHFLVCPQVGGTCSMICRMVLSRTTPDNFSDPASFGSVSSGSRDTAVWTFTPIGSCVHKEADRHSLAITNRSGISEASFSLAASAIGPNRTTGRRKPAADQSTAVSVIHSSAHRICSTYPPAAPPARRQGSVW